MRLETSHLEKAFYKIIAEIRARGISSIDLADSAFWYVESNESDDIYNKPSLGLAEINERISGIVAELDEPHISMAFVHSVGLILAYGLTESKLQSRI